MTLGASATSVASEGAVRRRRRRARSFASIPRVIRGLLAEMTSAEVSARRRVGKGGGHRASRAARAPSRKSNENGAIVRPSGMTYRLVSASKARRPVRVRDAQVAGCSPGTPRRPQASCASGRRAIRIYRTDECARSENDFCDAGQRLQVCRSVQQCTRARHSVVPFPSFRERPPISEKGEKRRLPHGGPTSRRAEHARTDRGAREASAVRTAEGPASVGGVDPAHSRGISRVAKRWTR